MKKEQVVLELMDKWKKTFEKKNNDYGSSWEKTGKIIEILFDGKPINVFSAKQLNAFALLVRILDKICRFVSLYFLNNKQKVNDESLSDSLADMGTYGFMLAGLMKSQDESEDASHLNVQQQETTDQPKPTINILSTGVCATCERNFVMPPIDDLCPSCRKLVRKDESSFVDLYESEPTKEKPEIYIRCGSARYSCFGKPEFCDLPRGHDGLHRSKYSEWSYARFLNTDVQK